MIQSIYFFVLQKKWKFSWREDFISVKDHLFKYILDDIWVFYGTLIKWIIYKNPEIMQLLLCIEMIIAI